jgi:hypothetical protein
MSLLFHTSTRHAARDFPNMGQSKGQAASLEKQLQRMQQARQPLPPNPQKKRLPRLERMDTSDSLNTRDSFAAPAKPLSTPHPASSKSRSKSRKSVAAPPPPPPHKLASSAKGGVKPVDVPPPPPQKQVDLHAVKSLLDDLATTLRSVADGRTACFGFENHSPPRRNEFDDDFDAQMRDLRINPSGEDVRLWETQLRLWRGPVNKDASSTTIDLDGSTNVEVHREVLISAVRKMGKHVREHVREDHHHRKLAKELLTDFMSVATMDRGEIYYVLDNPAKPTTTTTRASPMKQVNREAVMVLQELVRRCGGAVKQPPASKRRRRPRRRPKKDNSLKRALAKGRAADARANGL